MCLNAWRLGVAVDERTGLPELMASIVAELPAGRWLLVFDDIENPDTLMSSLPAVDGGHVIITVQGDYDGGVGDGVGAFSRAESVALLRRRSPSLGEEDADRIAEVLADMPLAVEQAAIYLGESGLSGEECLAALRERQGSTPFEPIFTLAVERLALVAPPAWWLLRLLAQFEAGEVERALLVPVADADVPDQVRVLLTDPQLMTGAFRAIVRHALAMYDWRRERVRLHPVIRELIRAHTAVADRIRLARLAEVLEGRVETDVDWTTDAPAEVDLLKRDALAEVLAGRITRPDSGIPVPLCWFMWTVPGDPARRRCSTCSTPASSAGTWSCGSMPGSTRGCPHRGGRYSPRCATRSSATVCGGAVGGIAYGKPWPVRGVRGSVPACADPAARPGWWSGVGGVVGVGCDPATSRTAQGPGPGAHGARCAVDRCPGGQPGAAVELHPGSAAVRTVRLQPDGAGR